MLNSNGSASNRLLVGRGTDAGSNGRIPNNRSPRGVSMRVRLLVALSLAAALLVAAYALIATSPLQAQTTPQTTTTTLVSNIDVSGYHCENGFKISGVSAQSFTTGPDTDGYPILEVRLFLWDGGGRSTNIMIKEDDNGEPGTLVAALTNPDSFTNRSLNTFTAPEGTTLDPDTTYWITVNEDLADGVRSVILTATGSDNDSGEIGWSIGNERLVKLTDEEDWVGWTSTLYIEIKSTEGTVTASSDASLAGIHVYEHPNSPHAVVNLLRPDFHPAITEYTAPAPNWLEGLNVVVRTGTVRASSVFSMRQRPSSRAAFAIDHGSTPVTVTVTAEDGSTRIYTITVERAADPPEPTDCPTDTTWCATMETDHFRHVGDWNGPKMFEGAGYVVSTLDGNMSSREFDHGGRRYLVLRIDWYRQSSPDGGTVYVDRLKFWAEPALPKGSVLQLDDRTFTFGGSWGLHFWGVAADPFDWELGDHVTVSVKLPDSDNADLGDLALTDADDNPISLTPDEFDRNVTDYTAVVDNAIDSVTLAAAPKDSNATVVIANDDDTSTPGEAALDIDVGSNNVLSVVVTSQSGDATKTYFVTVTRAATQLQSANTPATGAPTISGTAQVGQTLTAITSGIDDADGLVNASFDYQWQRQDLGTSAETDIPGATGATYEVTSDDRDSAVRVSVSFSDAAENIETLSSYWSPGLRRRPTTCPRECRRSAARCRWAGC